MTAALARVAIILQGKGRQGRPSVLLLDPSTFILRKFPNTIPPCELETDAACHVREATDNPVRAPLDWMPVARARLEQTPFLTASASPRSNFLQHDVCARVANWDPRTHSGSPRYES